MNKLSKLALLTTAIVSLSGFELYAAETNWNVSLWGKRRAFTEHVEKLAELVSQKTNGEFKLNISYGGLSKNKENLDGISIGAFEMAQFCAGYHRDKNPTITVLELPFMGVSNLKEEVAVARAIYEHPAAQKDLARWNAKLLMTSPMPQYNVAGVGEAPKALGDFEGMRIRATGGLGNAFKTVGATPTSVTATEAYTALESGVVDAVAFAQHAHLSFRTIDIAKWWTANLNPGTVNCPVVVNTDAYAALPDAHRKALDESIQPAIDHYLENYAGLLEKWETILAEKGVQKIEYSQQEIDAFKAKAATPVREAWLAQMKEAGVPGEELIKVAEDALAKAKASN